jgi:hypothetical protein
VLGGYDLSDRESDFLAAVIDAAPLRLGAVPGQIDGKIGS